MNKTEILAPAGSMESVAAAVRAGADAVYVGGKRFSARAHAENFDEKGLRECAAYCHERDVSVYLALNTVIFDDEMNDALALAVSAAKSDVDAVIVQDMGLAKRIGQVIPGMRLHASTQMTVHTPYGAKALFELGFKRAVLSRELSRDEIRAIHEFCPAIELEVFIHGALCMCTSGQCYFSSMLGGRSANRGMCAQPCRLPFFSGENDHALSLKDNSAVDFIGDFPAIGITSAKIEGRMKRPEYTATAVRACVEARDEGGVSPATRERLRSVFSRTGFTDGYFRGNPGEEMFGFRQKEDVLSADAKLLKDIRNSYKDERQSTPVRFEFSAKRGEKARLRATDDRGNEVFSKSEYLAEEAKTLPLSKERITAALSKTGGTHFFCESVHIAADDGISVPIASLNAMRRETLRKLDEKRRIRHAYEIFPLQKTAGAPQKNQSYGEEKTPIFDWVCLKRLEIPKNFGDNKIVFTDIDGLFDDEKIKKILGQNSRLGVEIPRVMFGREEEIKKRLQELFSLGVKDALAHNIGAIRLAKETGFSVHGGFGLNVTNSAALEFFQSYGLTDCEISVELDRKRIENLETCLPVGVLGYGYQALMITRNNPLHDGTADMDDDKSCKMIGFLQDRKGEKFPVLKSGDVFEIMNIVPTVVPKNGRCFQNRVFHVFRFSVENSVENEEKILEKMGQNPSFERFTRGMFTRALKNSQSNKELF